MTIQEQEKRFLENAKTVLDQDAEDLDGATVSRLRQLRYAALEKSETIGPNWWQRFRLPAAALITASLIAIVLGVQMKTPADLKAANPIEDIEILASNEQLDLYEDFDFYTWLAEAQQDAG